MNRRLFVGQCVTGLALLCRPKPLFADSLSSHTNQLRSAAGLEEAAKWLRNGLLGSIERVSISHVYTPEVASRSALTALAQQTVEQVAHLLGKNLNLDPKALCIHLLSAQFGSYSTRFEQAGIPIVWQGLARIGGKNSAPTNTIRVCGSKGILQSVPGGSGFQLINLKGQVVRSEKLSGYALNRFSRRSFFTV